MPTVDSAVRPRLLLITGMSGSGKSAAAKALEDLGYFCVDNLPLPLLRRFIFDTFEFVQGETRIAVVTDVRAPGFANDFPKIVRELDRHDVEPTLIFLEASDESLVRRFTESRRPHPLAANRPLIEGIAEERGALAELRDAADLIFDTTDWSVHDLRDHLYAQFGNDSETLSDLVVSIVSFGFKFGIPYGTDTLFDVRFLPNPYFEQGLREQTGLDLEVREFLDRQPEFHDLAQRIADLMLYLLPRYKRENRRYFSVAVGCTGGKHRSVAIAARLASILEGEGWSLRVAHRDIERSN